MEKSNKVLIDTNVLIYMYKSKRDIFEFVEKIIPDAKFYVLDETYTEIDYVFKNKVNKKRLFLNFLEKLHSANKFEILKVDKSILKKYKVDDILLYLSDEYIIYTNDRKLKEKIKNKNGRVFVLKEKSAVFV